MKQRDNVSCKGSARAGGQAVVVQVTSGVQHSVLGSGQHAARQWTYLYFVPCWLSFSVAHFSCEMYVFLCWVPEAAYSGSRRRRRQ